MDFKRIKCPHCGKELPIPPDSKSLMCIFCFNSIELSDDNVSGKLSEDEAGKGEFVAGGALTPALPSATSPEKNEQTWTASDRSREVVPPVSLQKSSGLGATSPEIKNRKLLYIVAGFACVMLFLIMAYIMNSHSSSASIYKGQQKNIEENKETPVEQASQQKSAATQKTPIQVLQAFHQNITNKKYREAYNYLSKDFQDYVSYDGWAPGFRTTISSTVSDVTTVSQTDSYTLKAVDNPGGTRYFRGTATFIKTADGWKIDEITNKAQ